MGDLRMESEIRDIALWQGGEQKIEWVRRNMPLLRRIEEQFAEEKPFYGKRIALSTHLEAKTAYLCRVLRAGGADMFVTGSNPLSTQDDVAAALSRDGMHVYAIHGCDAQTYLNACVAAKAGVSVAAKGACAAPDAGGAGGGAP